jgi:hypothetical protein
MKSILQDQTAQNGLRSSEKQIYRFISTPSHRTKFSNLQQYVRRTFVDSKLKTCFS